MSTQNILLHLQCLRVKPNHLPFHIKGIIREFRLLPGDIKDLVVFLVLDLPKLLWIALPELTKKG